jgi:hypothetical protein
MRTAQRKTKEKRKRENKEKMGKSESKTEKVKSENKEKNQLTVRLPSVADIGKALTPIQSDSFDSHEDSEEASKDSPKGVLPKKLDSSKIPTKLSKPRNRELTQGKCEKKDQGPETAKVLLNQGRQRKGSTPKSPSPIDPDSDRVSENNCGYFQSKTVQSYEHKMLPNTKPEKPTLLTDRPLTSTTFAQQYMPKERTHNSWPRTTPNFSPVLHLSDCSGPVQTSWTTPTSKFL